MPQSLKETMAESSTITARHPHAATAPPGGLILDRAVLQAVPNCSEIVSIKPCGDSAWSMSTARFTVKHDNDTIHEYFVKIVDGDLASERVLGEYQCMFELSKTMPSLVPMPQAFGPCLDSDGFFFLCDYLPIDHRRPDPVKLAEKVSELHRRSMSPTGQFGFHVTPYDGKLPLKVEWDRSWVSFYSKLLRGVYELDTQANGSWHEFDVAMRVTLEKVIPKLLGPLEEGGRSVKPCLIHGDLWEKNIGTHVLTNGIYIFDSCAYYAHHEMALGMWRVSHHQMTNEEYRDEYFKLFKPDEPVEHCDDRNRLYSIKERIMYSAHVPGTEARTQALDDMRYLIAKFVE
ncbi:Fructosamine kinase-domain-containing protein [Astrocystis sublimbata]|nr:Fructosamine kinase-domain-containing protein [Astrocystis sublimbata]